jgi:hypothetical protein
MFQSKGLIGQIAMVESKSELNRGFKKKVNLPAAIFNRSPLREPESIVNFELRNITLQ